MLICLDECVVLARDGVTLIVQQAVFVAELNSKLGLQLRIMSKERPVILFFAGFGFG